MKEYKDVKLTVIAFTDAVVHPWAVMVIAIHTMLAENAVSTSRRPDDFTVRAKTASLECVKQFDKIEIWIFLDYSWVTPPDDDAEEDCRAKQPLRRPKQPVRMA